MNSQKKDEQERYRDAIPALLEWYDYNARVLPWRSDPRPYHVWISEIMLQQTRVEAVKSYYERFLAQMPDIRSVAEADSEILMKLWEGLGYYSRIRNFQRAAQVVCEEYGGELPKEPERLRKLPGIGDYTAGAIASIAYGIAVPAVDGNVLRVFARVTGFEGDVRGTSFKKEVTKQLTEAMAKESRPGALNQAIMDIGATVCIPNGAPHCDRCPLAFLCRAMKDGSTDRIPAPKSRKERSIERKTVLYIICDGTVLLHRRPNRGLLAGMWEFPNLDGHTGVTTVRKKTMQLLNELLENSSSTNVERMAVGRLADSKFSFSHVDWEMRGYRVRITGPKVRPDGTGITGSMEPSDGKLLPKEPGAVVCGGEEYRFVTEEELATLYSIPTAFGAYKNTGRETK